MEAPIARGNRGEEETSRREVVRSTSDFRRFFFRKGVNRMMLSLEEDNIFNTRDLKVKQKQRLISIWKTNIIHLFERSI